MADEIETAEKNHNGQSVNWTWTVHEMDNNYNVTFLNLMITLVII